MTVRTFVRCFLIALLLVSVLLSAGCGITILPDGPASESGTAAPDDPGKQAGVPERKSVEMTCYELQDIYTQSEGNMTAMVIPIRVSGFPDYDDAFFSRLDEKMIGSNPQEISVQQYFRNASYGKLEIGYERMPTYDSGLTSTDFYRSDFSFPDFAIRAFADTINAYEGDLSKFDSNGDGSADIVIFFETNPHDPYYYEFCPNDVQFAQMKESLPLALANGVRVGIDTLTLREEEFWGSGDQLIHEISHLFGIMDYYDYSGSSQYISYDMQDYLAAGDWNVFSKLSVGWIDPYVIEPGTESATVTLRASAEHGDALLIPTGNGWNGTPWDEYILVDVLADRGNNVLSWNNGRSVSISDHCPEGGVRVYHVDARIYIRDKADLTKPTVWLEDFPDYDRTNRYTEPAFAYSNYTRYEVDPNSLEALSPAPDPRFHLLHLLHSSGKGKIIKYFRTDYLFGEGQSLSMESHKNLFPNYPQMDNGSALDYEIIVERYDENAAEAVVTVRKVH